MNIYLIIYFILLVLLLYIVKRTNNFSYVFIASCLIATYIYLTQKKYNIDEKIKIDKRISDLKELNINENLLLARDKYLVNLLYSARFIKFKEPNAFIKLINYIEDFIVTFETLKQNINNIFLKPDDLIRPLQLNKLQKSILINDLRDQLERIMQHIETFIHVIPNEIRYLNGYYEFSQLIKFHLTKYYQKILIDNNINDHTSQYQLLRSSENKYGFLDW